MCVCACVPEDELIFTHELLTSSRTWFLDFVIAVQTFTLLALCVHALAATVSTVPVAPSTNVIYLNLVLVLLIIMRFKYEKNQLQTPVEWKVGGTTVVCMQPTPYADLSSLI